MMKDLKIVYMGTPEFAVGPLDLLVQEEYNIVAVVTAPDRPAGRGKKLRQSPVKLYAAAHDIDILQPTNLKNDAFLDKLRNYQADLQIVVAFRILPEAVWNMPLLGTFNLHASLLPQYRGAAPMNWAIINGEKETGVTTFFLDHKVDTGNIIYSEATPIGDNETIGELHDRLKLIGSQLVKRTVDGIISNDIKSIDQNKLLAEQNVLHKAPKIFKVDRCINWDDSAKNIHNLIRGLSPYPGAFTELISPEEKRYYLKIYRSEKIITDHDHNPGTISTDGKTFLNVNAKDGMIALSEIQLSSKRKIFITDFLKGFKIDENWRMF